MGKTPARNTPAFWNGTNAWVSISDLTSSRKYISQTRECITDNAITRTGIKKIPKDTLLMSFKLSLGKVAITTTDIYTNEAIMAFIDKKKYDVDIHYMYHYFQAIDWTIGTNKAVKGITLNKRALSEKVVDLPPINIQQEIAERMDNLNAVTENLQRQSMLLDELVKSQFIEMFGDPVTNPMGWETVKIADTLIVEPQNGLYKPQSDYVHDKSGIPILRIDGFYEGKVSNWLVLKRLKCTKEEIQKYLLHEGDIVINRVNSIEHLGKCAHISNLHEPTVYESNMMRMHFDPTRFNPVYITRLLCTQYIYNQIINHSKKAVNQASINQKDVMDFNIYHPPLALQNEFAAFIEQVDKSKLVLRQLLEKQKMLKAALMQEYFS